MLVLDLKASAERFRGLVYRLSLRFAALLSAAPASQATRPCAKLIFAHEVSTTDAAYRQLRSDEAHLVRRTCPPGTDARGQDAQR